MLDGYQGIVLRDGYKAYLAICPPKPPELRRFAALYRGFPPTGLGEALRNREGSQGKEQQNLRGTPAGNLPYICTFY